MKSIHEYIEEGFRNSCVKNAAELFIARGFAANTESKVKVSHALLGIRLRPRKV